MLTDAFTRSNVIEECYEFMLAYAAQGLPTDEGSQSGAKLRESLEEARQALSGLAESCAIAMGWAAFEPPERFQAFLQVLDRDARDSLAAIELVSNQPVISSQLIDNLNASIHLRALLTDLFLLGEILRERSRAAHAVDRVQAATPITATK
jgi:hypothetical protein